MRDPSPDSNRFKLLDLTPLSPATVLAPYPDNADVIATDPLLTTPSILPPRFPVSHPLLPPARPPPITVVSNNDDTCSSGKELIHHCDDLNPWDSRCDALSNSRFGRISAISSESSWIPSSPGSPPISSSSRSSTTTACSLITAGPPLPNAGGYHNRRSSPSPALAKTLFDPIRDGPSLPPRRRLSRPSPALQRQCLHLQQP